MATTPRRFADRGWSLSTPASYRTPHCQYPPYGQTPYPNLLVSVKLSHPELAQQSVKRTKKIIEVTRHQIQLERVAAEAFLDELLPHLEQQFDPHDQNVLNALFVKFQRYRNTIDMHLERIVWLMHQERRKCSEYARLLRASTLLIKPDPARDLHDFEELQIKYNRALVAVNDRLAVLAHRGGTNPRWHQYESRRTEGPTEVVDVNSHPLEAQENAANEEC
jgi:hypothetical protein